MAKVTIEIESDEIGGTKVKVAFDPPLVPGMNVPASHRIAYNALKGSPLRKAVLAFEACGLDVSHEV